LVDIAIYNVTITSPRDPPRIYMPGRLLSNPGTYEWLAMQRSEWNFENNIENDQDSVAWPGSPEERMWRQNCAGGVVRGLFHCHNVAGNSTRL
jgi:hypothetical protein